MKLYHGSTEIVEKPKILKATHFLDFGFGFYTTTSEVQAIRWATIKKKRINSSIAFLNSYQLDDSVLDNRSFSLLSFESPTLEWLKFVIGNRRGETINDYDFIKGPVANDALYQTITLYESSVLSLDETIARLKVHELFDQLSFHSEKALKNLKFIEAKSI
jgi:hypothetical protein